MSAARVRVVLTFMLGVAGLPACSATRASDRHLADMREAMHDGDDDRSSMFEAALQDEPGRLTKQAPPSAAPHASAPPRSINLGSGDDANENDDPNDPTARPAINLVGPPGAAARQARSSRARGRSDDGPTRGRDESSTRTDESSRENR